MRQTLKPFVIPGLALALMLFTGAGCSSLSNVYQQATEVATNTAANKMSETEYYNKVIQQMNGMSDYTGVVSDGYDRFVAYDSVEQRSSFTAQPTYAWYDSAKKDLVDSKPEMQNAEAQQKIEAKLVPYIGEYKTMLDAYKALGEYYERGRYKDDNEAQKDALVTPLSESIDKVYDMQEEIFTLVEEYQSQVDLGIDENTQDPIEVATLAQDKITGDAKKLYKEYSTWIEAYDKDGKADTTAMQAAYDQYKTDLATYSARADVAKVKDISFAGTSWTSYVDAAGKLEIKFENVLRDAKADSIKDLVTLDEEVLDIYNDLIDAHNSLVSSLDTAASLPQ